MDSGFCDFAQKDGGASTVATLGSEARLPALLSPSPCALKPVSLREVAGSRLPSRLTVDSGFCDYAHNVSGATRRVQTT